MSLSARLSIDLLIRERKDLKQRCVDGGLVQGAICHHCYGDGCYHDLIGNGYSNMSIQKGRNQL